MSSQLKAQALDNSGRREGGHVGEMQRRRLLLAFAEVLAEGGLEDAGVGRVCKRAGVSRRTFYDLFEDREACFLAVVDVAIERVSQSVLSAYEQESLRWRERIRAALAALLEFFDAEPALARACLIETPRAGAAVCERRRQVFDSLAVAVDEGRRESKYEAGPPPLTAQSTVGGALSVIHARVLEDGRRPLLELLNPLMGMIVHPYLGPAAARRELDRVAPQPVPRGNCHASRRAQDPFKGLPIRLTFRTARVLGAIGARSGVSNREVGEQAGVLDQGQISKLLRRLEGHGLIENRSEGHAKGEPNAWRLTERGDAVRRAIELP
ncbi:MAG TPA: TetR family transcriptional regulator [Solirubrobacteraceae bacterium]|nr:TetR family transcriptional regulator [Solirubrobacteraceae bacterium]